MRADICEPSDKLQLAKFKRALVAVGAEAAAEHLALGVQLVELDVGGDTLRIFADPWSVDVESTPDVVNAILTHMHADKTA